jgi:hypothetical protein
MEVVNYCYAPEECPICQDSVPGTYGTLCERCGQKPPGECWAFACNKHAISLYHISGCYVNLVQKKIFVLLLHVRRIRLLEITMDQHFIVHYACTVLHNID